jgi:hypothetical protein
METYSPMPHADNLSRALLAAILLCLAVAVFRGGASSEAGDAAEAAALQSQDERYAFQVVGLLRKPSLILRVDTATGEAWSMGVLSAGRWDALREGPDGVPSAGAEEAGRYEIHAVKLRRGAPNLVRTDLQTGRIWRKGSTSVGAWVAVPNPGEQPLAAAKPVVPVAESVAAEAVDEVEAEKPADEPDAENSEDEAE